MLLSFDCRASEEQAPASAKRSLMCFEMLLLRGAT